MSESKTLDFQQLDERFEAERQANDRVRDEWSCMLFKGKPYDLDEEKRARNLEQLRRLWLLKEGLRVR